jgi:hypothetical protein
MLANIVFGAVLAGASLGPSAWTEIAQVDARLSRAALLLTGMEEAGSPLDHAAAKARAVLPDLSNGAH